MDGLDEDSNGRILHLFGDIVAFIVHLVHLACLLGMMGGFFRCREVSVECIVH